MIAEHYPDLSNALVNQKDSIIQDVNNVTDVDQFDRVLFSILLVRPVFEAAGYGYKLRELNARVRDRAQQMLADEEAYLLKCRKNDKTRGGTERDIRKLRNVLATVEPGC